jgi:hypothetical protein
MEPWDARSWGREQGFLVKQKELRRCKKTGRWNYWRGRVEKIVGWQKQQPAVGDQQALAKVRLVEEWSVEREAMFCPSSASVVEVLEWCELVADGRLSFVPGTI